MVAFLVLSELENLSLFTPIGVLKAITSAASKLSCEGNSMKNIESDFSKN